MLLLENMTAKESEESVRSVTISLILGVLTKADRVQAGNQEPWLSLLRNGDGSRHGYYVTRQRDPSQIGHLLWRDAREQEREFLSRPPWGEVNEDRRGVEKLEKALSQQLSRMIEQRYLFAYLC